MGKWICVYDAKIPNMRTSTLKVELHIIENGTGYGVLTFTYQGLPGKAFTAGSFKGQNAVSWTETRPSGQAKRVGDKLFIYPDKKGGATLVKGSPAGFTLHDYETMGGALPQGIFSAGYAAGVSVYQISGKDLILESSQDNNRWLYKWAGK